MDDQFYKKTTIQCVLNQSDGEEMIESNQSSAQIPVQALLKRFVIRTATGIATAFFLVFSFVAVTSAQSLEQLESEIKKRLPDIDISSIAETPIDGVYEMISGGQIYYIGASGKHIIDGDLIDLDTRANLTADRLGRIHIGLINNIKEEDMLIYPSTKDTGRSITVFTDTSCGFCRKLHQELDVLLDAGISVRYLLFPRAGVGSAAHKNLESVWCAENPQAAMTIAKAGGEVAQKACSNPIRTHMAMAEQVGLRGTPLIYLDTGQQIPGYRAAADLVRLVNEGQPVE